jgi:hypothetical protein
VNSCDGDTALSEHIVNSCDGDTALSEHVVNSCDGDTALSEHVVNSCDGDTTLVGVGCIKWCSVLCVDGVCMFMEVNTALEIP